jgi:hypothetical protein
MKKKLLLSVFTLSVFLSFNVESKAQLKLIHYWHFNNWNSGFPSGPVVPSAATMPGKKADYSALDTNHAVLWDKEIPGTHSEFMSYWDNLAGSGDTINERKGYGGCCGETTQNAMRARNPNDSMELAFYMPTNGYSNLVMTWETESSSTGSGCARQLFAYSTDSGKTFTTATVPVTVTPYPSGIKGTPATTTASYDSAGTSWGLVSLNLSSITAINNNSKFVFRIQLSAPNSGASGNNRFDNITLEGTSLSGIDPIQAEAMGYNLYPNPSSQKLTIVSPSEGSKLIEICNLMGQIISSTQTEGKQFPVEISNLNNGVYFVYITEKSNGARVPLKFIKN